MVESAVKTKRIDEVSKADMKKIVADEIIVQGGAEKKKRDI